MKALWPDLKGYRAQLVLGPLFKLAEAILELLVPLLMADIIDVGVKTGDVRYIVTHGLAMLGLGAVGLGCALVCQYFAAVCAQGFGRSLRHRLFRRVAFSRSQYGAVGTDSLITRLTSDANQVQTGVNMFIRLAVRAPFLTVGSIVMAFTISARAGMVFLVSTPLIVLVLYAVMRKTLPMYGAIQAGQDGIARLAGEHLEGVRVIRAFGRQKAEVQAFDAAGDALAAATVRAGVISAALNPITSVIANLAIVAIVWMGAGLANTGGLEQGQIIALVNYMTQTLLALIVLANIIVILTKALASAKRVSEVLALAPEMAAVPQAEAPAQPGKEGAPALELDNVAFTYPGGGEPGAGKRVPARGRGPHAGHHWRHGLRQNHVGAACGARVRRHGRGRAPGRVRTCAACPWPRCTGRWAWCRRRRACSAARCAAICRWAARPPQTKSCGRRWRRRRPRPLCAKSRGWTRPWKRAAKTFPAGSASALPLRAPWPQSPPCWCWTIRPARWTPPQTPPCAAR